MEIKKNGNLALKLLFLMVLGVTVTSCGGDNPASSSTTDSGTSTDTTTSDTTRQMGSGVGSSFAEGAVTVYDTTLSAGGRTSLSVNIVNASGELVTDSVAVTFNSVCVANGDATLSTATVSTTTGTATTDYTAAGCEGVDDVTATATVGSQTLRATTQITVAAAEIGSVDFESASTESIAFQGSGTSSRPSKSTLTFKVLDKNGNGVKGRTISFALSTSVGGISLSSSSATTDSSGTVTTTLNAGTVTTTVRVTATYTPDAGVPIYTTSNSININIGIADQNSFDIAIDNFNPNAYHHNNVEVNVTVNAADKNNNWVPDGTVINFVASYGGIPGSCETTSGSCSVKWRSSGARPADGKVTILARTVGEESFSDLNSNGRFDTTELASVTQLSDAFLDSNWNGSHDSDESYYDFDNNSVFTAADTLFNGLNCTDNTTADNAIAAGHCASLVEVRASHRITMASDVLDVQISGSGLQTDPNGTYLDVSDGNTHNITVDVADELGNCPPSGTVISVAINNGSIVTGQTSITTPNMFNCSSPYSFDLGIKNDDTPAERASLVVTATPPAPSANLTYSAQIDIKD